jgi:LPXTG-motif cell wall-anchored protein
MSRLVLWTLGACVLALALIVPRSALAAPSAAYVAVSQAPVAAAPLQEGDDDNDDDDDDDGGADNTLPNTGVSDYVPLIALGLGAAAIAGGVALRRRVA